jgi:hypothetical protein
MVVEDEPYYSNDKAGKEEAHESGPEENYTRSEKSHDRK